MTEEYGPKEHEWLAWASWFANYDGTCDRITVRKIIAVGFAMRHELREAIATERDACARAAEENDRYRDCGVQEAIAAAIRARGVA